MTFLDSTLLGIVEGITEFLPVSSTGHLMIASKLLGITPTTFSKTFEIAIQSGAILAVCVLYFRRLLAHKELIPKITVAFTPTLIAGVVLYPLIKNVFLENILIVFYSLIVGGIIMLLVEKYNKNTSYRELESITYRESFILGILQIFALIPGVSRSGATIIGGMALSYPRIFLIEFSFLLALPTILGATVYDVYKNHTTFSSNETMLLVTGIVVSAVVAYAIMKTFLNYLKKNSFVIFGWYRIAIGIIGLVFFY